MTQTTAILGAGPIGLAAAVHAPDCGMEPLILEQCKAVGMPFGRGPMPRYSQTGGSTLMQPHHGDWSRWVGWRQTQRRSRQVLNWSGGISNHLLRCSHPGCTCNVVASGSLGRGSTRSRM